MVKSTQLSRFNTIWSLLLAVLNVGIYSQDRQSVFLWLFLFFACAFVLKQVYYFIRLGYIVIKYGPNKAPEPPDNYQESLHLPMGWWFSAVSLILLLATCLVSLNLLEWAIFVITLVANIYFYIQLKK